jgi:hypothetical protein
MVERCCEAVITGLQSVAAVWVGRDLFRRPGRDRLLSRVGGGTPVPRRETGNEDSPGRLTAVDGALRPLREAGLP